MDETLTAPRDVGRKRFQPYPAYKDSGVEWLGQVPSHWSVKRLKYLSTLNDEVLPESTYPSLEIAYVDIGSVDAIAGITGTETIVFERAPSRARRVVRTGDVIVSTIRTYLRAIAAIVTLESNLIVSTGFAVLRPRRLDSSFASYALRAPYFVERVVSNSVGISYPAINASRLACFPIAYPEVDEQRAIAAFLDRETAQIDALVAKQERLIELFQEKRAAAIDRLFTTGRGLLSTTTKRLKIDGVPKDVPENWKSTKLRRLISPIARPVDVQPTTEYQEIGIRSWGKGIFHKDPTNGSCLEEKKVFYVEPGDFVLNIVFAWEGAVAVASRAETGMIASHRFPTFRHTEGLTEIDYLLLFLQSEHGRALMALHSPGAAGRNRTLRIDSLLDEEVPLPTLAEQREIVYAFREQERLIDDTVTKARTLIDQLKEFRTALISAAVTGRIDVRPPTHRRQRHDTIQAEDRD